MCQPTKHLLSLLLPPIHTFTLTTSIVCLILILMCLQCGSGSKKDGAVQQEGLQLPSLNQHTTHVNEDSSDEDDSSSSSDDESSGFASSNKRQMAYA